MKLLFILWKKIFNQYFFLKQFYKFILISLKLIKTELSFIDKILNFNSLNTIK